MKVRTDDGVELGMGDRAFNYYDMKPGVIASEPVDDRNSGFYGWFDFRHDEGGKVILNGQRICSLRFAQSRGWLENAAGGGRA